MAAPIKNHNQNTVFGTVTDANGRPLTNLKVVIYDVDMREWQALAEMHTNSYGKYELKWSHEQLSGRGRKTADIAVKVFTKEKNTELYKSAWEEVRFNASEREEINIILRKSMPTEVIEFDFLLKEMTFLAKKIAIADLQENKEHRDVTFLSKELQVPAEKIEHLIVAHRLNSRSKIEVAFFYALLRKNTLLHNDFAKNLNARLSIGIDVEDQIVLYDAALTDSKKIETAVKTAVEEKIIASASIKQLKRSLELLTQYKEEAANYYKNEQPKKVINLLSGFFKEGKLQEVQQVFTANKNDLNTFFEKVTNPSFFATKEKEKEAKTTIELSKLFGFGNEVIPQISKSRGIKKPEDAKKLAKLNKAEWEKEIKKARPDIKDKKVISTYASAIVRKMEKEFPTQAFVAQLERAKKPSLKNQEKIVAFFHKHEDFDLMKHNVDLFLKKKKVLVKDKELIGEELKSVQRIFKLIPNYSKTIALREEKVHSSQNIVAIGKTRFIKEIAPKAGISEKEAKVIYRKAETKHTAAMLMVGDMQDTMSVMDIESFETKILALKLEAVSKDFPNLKSLFKLVDTCECEHCRSVYSPAAYLVEILQFLGQRMVLANNAKSMLFERRPELGEIDLGCANANTPVKYIDLVCEILEEAVAPEAGVIYSGVLSDGADPLKGKISNNLRTALTAAGMKVTAEAMIYETASATTKPHYLRDKGIVCKIENTGGNNYKIYRLRQTFGTAEELDAAPEYVNESAYTELRSKNFAFKLPFDLQHTEAKAYLSRFDVNRADLMKAFQSAATPTDLSIAAERLGLTAAERILIENTPNPNDNNAQQSYWNVPAPGNVVDYLKQVDHFLDKSGLTYKELDLLLKLKFINKNNNLYIKHNDQSCDTEKKEIANLDLNTLDRIHRLLRLQKKMGWKLEVVDEIITQKKLGNGSLNDTCLIKTAQLKEIAEKTNSKIEELIGFFGEIPHTVLLEDSPKPLYQQIFLNKAKNGVSNESLLPEKINGSQLLNPFVGYIATCLQLKEKELEILIQLPHQKSDGTIATTLLLTDNNLTFANLSQLFAASRLLKKLKLKAEDIATIQKLSGLNYSASPEKMLQFIEVIDNFKNSPLKATDCNFLLNHQALNLSEREIKVEKIEDLLGKLKTAYIKINEEQKSKFDDKLSADEQRETLITTLSGLEGMEENDVKTIVKFLDKDWSEVTNPAGAKAFIDEKLDKRIQRTESNTAIDALAAVAAGADASNEQKDLIKALLGAIAHFQISVNKQTLVEQLVSTSFKLDLIATGIIFKYAKLKQIAPGTDLLATLLTDNFENAITEANYSKQYDAIKLLHKMIPLLNAFKLSSTEIEWYFNNNSNAALDWFEWDSIPFKGGQTTINFAKYVAFCRIVAYSKAFTPTANPLDAEKPISFFTMADFVLLGGAVGRDEFLNDLAILTGYEKGELDAIDAHLFAAFDLANYKNPENWERIIACAEYLRKLGATVTQIKKLINETLTSAEVNELRTILKSRYDEDTWLGTLKEIMDSIRPQKRKALVAYLLATNANMKDENDLYEYFLVDVEMEACMPSSRIVLAHNSIQLFVQRCLLGLEPDAIADVEKDPNWNQWKWMKNYRVWEANRKVFLYPENWYDVTLTDDKTYLLNEFINEIQQNELTNDTAEEALKKYLEKLDNIAFLEVMATWYDVPTRDMHVFARTKGGEPSIYYYRRFENEQYWSPWEKVELDITGNHLLAFKRNNRLHLAWPMFSEEAQPNQQSKVPAASDQGSYVDTDKPKKKLKIQVAISEYNNKKWQPKRVSNDGILTPSNFSADESDFKRNVYSLKYFAWPKIKNFPISEVVALFKEAEGKENHQTNDLCGLFNIAGCKGYPELIDLNKLFGNNDFRLPFTIPDFLPDFEDTALLNQKYVEQNASGSDELSVRNGLSILKSIDFLPILNTTPGNFRISFPHQFTAIDLIALVGQILFNSLNNHSGHTAASNSMLQRWFRKIPQGTMLPYFDEDSNNAYVIIPGFYKKIINSGDIAQTYTLIDTEKRTASNVFQLIDDCINWFKKISAEFEETPVDFETGFQIILKDAGFQDILKELSKYADLDIVLNLLIGESGDPSVDEFLKELIEEEPLQYGEQFKNMYHPLVCALRSILNNQGVAGLMKRDTQMLETSFNFKSHYNPNTQIVPQTFIKKPDGTSTLSYPIEDIDFTSDGSYSAYNWDLFFRVPLHIATNLTKNQRFEEAMSWFHYMFNPTGALSGNGVQKYWVTKPFYLNQETDYIIQRIDTLMYAVADPSNPMIPTGAASDPAIRDLEFAISEWRNKPFRPDVVARFRPVAYQKALLMKYIDNLTEWGDYLFRQDTMESVAQATQMYILADKLLGPKPRIVPATIKQPYETYNQIEAKLESFGNALVELENILPDLSVSPDDETEMPASPITLAMLYFCIPANEKMFEYWDRVGDRLFKIRNCQNIEGVERSLALFAPPIDPGMLVRAAASGLDISSVIAGLNAPTPYYRFNVLSQKASELAQEVRGLGNSLLQALEKKDAEALTLLRNELEMKVLTAVKDIKKLQINESKEQIEVLKRTKKVTEERQKYYATIQKIISKEQLNLDKLKEANDYQIASQVVRTIAGALALIPEITFGASGFGGSPQVTAQIGGSAISKATSIGADILNVLGSIASYEASRASLLAGYDRRFDDWKLQERLANKELASIDKQITAAEIRKQIAETDLKNHELQMENAKKTDDFMRSKFTNKELYDWMIGQISAVYFKSYQLAHDFAKKAERSYRFELGNEDSFISYGYWDSMKKGLQSADHLIHDIKRMETGYLDKNKREYELIKHISLAQLDPLALVKLRASGICDFEIPEALYDLDHPGQYFRRIKSVSVSIPCIAGPYTSVSAKLSLVNNRYRKNPNDAANYAEDSVNGDTRFVYNVGAIQSIATSSAQNDSGVFELNFRDERYLPFENTGAISSWRLELPTEVKQFDYNTIADVIIHVKYTAREGGSLLKTAANTTLKEQLELIKQGLNQNGLHVALNLKHDLPNEWLLLKKNGTINLTIDKTRLPYMVQWLDNGELESVMFIAKIKDNPANFALNVEGVVTNLARVDELKLCKGINSNIELDTAFSLAIANNDKVKLEELLLLIKYKFKN